MTVVDDIVVRRLGRADYFATWETMRSFTRARDDSTADEFWVLEHPPVYTVGQGAPIPLVQSDIPVIKTDRGGDITYHGP
ncbi:MAG TPA: lipoyl(octanoyl) transferase, partial [Burkholderiales bacterium]|nr:lipoyl(octanoyl) transferase [Burkholderiales bacterium]